MKKMLKKLFARRRVSGRRESVSIGINSVSVFELEHMFFNTVAGVVIEDGAITGIEVQH